MRDERGRCRCSKVPAWQARQGVGLGEGCKVSGLVRAGPSRRRASRVAQGLATAAAARQTTRLCFSVQHVICVRALRSCARWSPRRRCQDNASAAPSIAAEPRQDTQRAVRCAPTHNDCHCSYRTCVLKSRSARSTSNASSVCQLQPPICAPCSVRAADGDQPRCTLGVRGMRPALNGVPSDGVRFDADADLASEGERRADGVRACAPDGVRLCSGDDGRPFPSVGVPRDGAYWNGDVVARASRL